MKKRIHFIINPKSGGRSKKHVPDLINKLISDEIFDKQVSFTKSEEHTIELAKSSVNLEYDYIIAVGGDGTINNIAKFVSGSKSILGIIPFGSGNGFARELKLYGNIENSLQIINQQNYQLVDTGYVNEHFFCNVAGVGFDAHVGGLFADSTTRGLKTYAKIILREISSYQVEKYRIQSNQGDWNTTNAFMICVCNGPQFGNNAFIAPEAKLNDGLFDIAIVKPFPLWRMPHIALSMLLKSKRNLPYLNRFKCTEFMIERESEGMVNVDGEPVKMGKTLKFTMHPNSLKILVPQSK